MVSSALLNIFAFCRRHPCAQMCDWQCHLSLLALQAQFMWATRRRGLSSNPSIMSFPAFSLWRCSSRLWGTPFSGQLSMLCSCEIKPCWIGRSYVSSLQHAIELWKRRIDDQRIGDLRIEKCRWCYITHLHKRAMNCSVSHSIHVTVRHSVAS